MFNETKFIVCIYFSKYKVFSSLAQITGNKVDISAFEEMKINNGIIEEGIVYDSEYLNQITKNLITSVSKTVKRIDAAWIAIPDNKIKIANIQVPQINNQIDDYEMEKLLEDKLQIPPSKLFLLNKPIHDINDNVFFLTYGIKPEHIIPYIETVKDIDIQVESVFPSFECIYTELKNYFTTATLFLYPYHTGYKFFIADENGVYMNSIWGHSIIELDNNFNKAIDEIISFASRSKDVALDIKKILIIENNTSNIELLQSFLSKIKLEIGWIHTENYKHYLIDEISLIILKGLLKNGARSNNPKGLLTKQPKKDEEIDHKRLHNIVNKNINNHQFISTPKEEKTLHDNHQKIYKLSETYNIKKIDGHKIKSSLISFTLTIILIASILYAGWKITDKLLQEDKVYNQNKTSVNELQPTPTLILTPTQTDNNNNQTLSNTPTQTPSPTPTPLPFTKNEIRVLVLNGNNRTGEAKLVTTILQTNGFLTKAPDNAPEKNIPTTSVKYKDKRALDLSNEIVKLIEIRYPSAKSEYDPSINEDIIVILGNN